MMKKVLFIDRDGTLIEEPHDNQVDELGKIRLVRGVVTALLELADHGWVPSRSRSNNLKPATNTSSHCSSLRVLPSTRRSFVRTSRKTAASAANRGRDC